MTSPDQKSRAPAIGLSVTIGLIVVAMALPAVTGWDVHVRWFPPLHAIWDPRLGPGTLPALIVGALGAWAAIPLAERLPWRGLLLAAYVAGVVWLFSLALVDGLDGVGAILGDDYEYLPTARETTDLPAVLREYVSRITYDGIPDDEPGSRNWPVHVAGHPPGALSFFVLLVRIGLGSALAAGVVVTLLAASTAVAVLVTLRQLGAEALARRAAPFLVLAPAAIWQSVSADGMFGAVAAWGMAALAAAAVRRSVAWAVVSGLLLGYAVMLSYGLPLLGLLALAILVVAGNWRPLPWSAAAALAVVLGFAAFGFYWWEALPEVQQRYWQGVASNRPPAYWMWGNLAALAVAAGPLLGAGVTTLWPRGLGTSGPAGLLAALRDSFRITGSGDPDAATTAGADSRSPAPAVAGSSIDPAREGGGGGLRTAHVASTQLDAAQVRVARWLAGAGVAMVLAADVSQMSRAEVERIWLPFLPWLLISCALLPERWRRHGLTLQIVAALVVQHLLDTGW